MVTVGKTNFLMAIFFINEVLPSIELAPFETESPNHFQVTSPTKRN